MKKFTSFFIAPLIKVNKTATLLLFGNGRDFAVESLYNKKSDIILQRRRRE